MHALYLGCTQRSCFPALRTAAYKPTIQCTLTVSSQQDRLLQQSSRALSPSGFCGLFRARALAYMTFSLMLSSSVLLSLTMMARGYPLSLLQYEILHHCITLSMALAL